MNLDKRPPVGVGVVVRCANHILLGKRKGAHGAGEWALPGGNPDAGESPREAAIRELAEETGIEVRRGLTAIPWWTYDRFEDEGLHYVTLYFKVTVDPNQQPQLREPDKCEGWRWVGVSEPADEEVSIWGGSDRQTVRIPPDDRLFCGVRDLALRGLL